MTKHTFPPRLILPEVAPGVDWSLRETRKDVPMSALTSLYHQTLITGDPTM